MNMETSRQLPERLRANLGFQILQRRRARRWSQRELGERAGLKTMRISRLENGRVTPSLPELVRLGEVLGSGLDELLGTGTPPAPAPPLQEIEELGTPEEWAVLGRLLRALAAGLRTTR